MAFHNSLPPTMDQHKYFTNRLFSTDLSSFSASKCSGFLLLLLLLPIECTSDWARADNGNKTKIKHEMNTLSFCYILQKQFKQGFSSVVFVFFSSYTLNAYNSYGFFLSLSVCMNICMCVYVLILFYFRANSIYFIQMICSSSAGSVSGFVFCIFVNLCSLFCDAFRQDPNKKHTISKLISSTANSAL